MNLGRDLKALNVVNSSGLLLMSTSLGHELKVLDAMNSSRLWTYE